MISKYKERAKKALAEKLFKNNYKKGREIHKLARVREKKSRDLGNM